MEHETKREKLSDQILDLCSAHNCSEKVRKIHFAQFVDRGWHPHPPQEFYDWWKKHRDNVIRTVIAFNTQIYYVEYLEAKQHGLIE